MKYIDSSWVKSLALGGQVLSSGGGGDTKNFETILEDIIKKKGKIQLVNVDDIFDNSYYCSNGMMGISNVIDSYEFTGSNGVDTIKRMEDVEECKISGIYPYEGAGINLLYPIITAKLMDLPIIDGDIMGRCFTQLQMTTLELNNISISPFILKDTMNIMHVFNGKSTREIESEIRKVLSRIDDLGFFASGIEKGEMLKKLLIPGTISFAKNIGDAFNNSSYEEIIEDIENAAENAPYGKVVKLFKARVISVEEAKFNKEWTRFSLIGIEENKKGIFSILAKDQFLLTYNNQKISCTSPDIIAAIDLETLKPVTFLKLKKDMEVGVFALEVPDTHKTENGINLMGLQAFGYKLPYKSIKELNE